MVQNCKQKVTSNDRRGQPIRHRMDATIAAAVTVALFSHPGPTERRCSDRNVTVSPCRIATLPSVVNAVTEPFHFLRRKRRSKAPN
jgi:hypothetical protein